MSYSLLHNIFIDIDVHLKIFYSPLYFLLKVLLRSSPKYFGIRTVVLKLKIRSIDATVGNSQDQHTEIQNIEIKVKKRTELN